MKAHEIHNVEELIKALRYCGNFEDRDGCDEKCPYFNDKDCPKRIMCDAADALEAAEKRIAELERILKAVQENSGINFRMWQEAEARMQTVTDCHTLGDANNEQ